MRQTANEEARSAEMRRIHAVTCPRCNAEPGHVCRTANGNPMQRNVFHAARMQTAAEIRPVPSGRLPAPSDRVESPRKNPDGSWSRRGYSHNEAAAVMRAAGYEPLEDYPGRNRIPWRCRCMRCGAERTPILSNVIKGRRCQGCTSRRSALRKWADGTLGKAAAGSAGKGPQAAPASAARAAA
jgi:hypothetical protein